MGWKTLSAARRYRRSCGAKASAPERSRGDRTYARQELEHDRRVDGDVAAEAEADEEDDGADGAPAVERAEDHACQQTRLVSLCIASAKMCGRWTYQRRRRSRR